MTLNIGCYCYRNGIMVILSLKVYVYCNSLYVEQMIVNQSFIAAFVVVKDRVHANFYGYICPL